MTNAQQKLPAGPGLPIGNAEAVNWPRLVRQVSLTRICALRRDLAAGRYDVAARLPLVVDALLREIRGRRRSLRRGA